MGLKTRVCFFFMLLFSLYCNKVDIIGPAGFEVAIEQDTIVFAGIGDFGDAGSGEKRVSDLVKSWDPDFIISAGDNNYPDGLLETIEENITQYYKDFIYNFDAPVGYQCNGRAFKDRRNRFFPTPGNHDANNPDELTHYYNFFTLPGNEVYYNFTWGSVSFYSINGVDGDLDLQKEWLKQKIASSGSAFHIVFSHYPPYSSGKHGDNEFMQWDYHGLGVDVVFTGHDHIYERVERQGEEGTYLIVNGLGGRAVEGCGITDQVSDFCYDGNFGALKGWATRDSLILEFFSIDSLQPIDQIIIRK